MNSSQPEKLLSLKQAAEKLAVSVDVLLAWNEHNILKPTITSEGQIGYTEKQLDQFSAIRKILIPLATQAEQITTVQEPTEFITTAQTPAHTNQPADEQPKHDSFYRKFIKWAGNEFYSDDFIKDYLHNQVKDSLTFTFKAPKFRMPSTKTFSLALALLLLLGIGAFTQQYRIKFFTGKVVEKFEQATNSGPSVLASQTSKMKIAGNISFRLPVTIKEQTTLKKNLLVEGTSVFKKNITAPNVIYGIKAGDHILIT